MNISIISEQEERGHHIWIIETIYRFTVYVEPVDGTIVESVAEVLPLNDECEEIKGL